MYSSLLKNQVPANWQRVSFSSLKPLASWYQDLHKRVEFMRTWMTKGHPKSYWLSGFFFPHGFMTGILQAYARKNRKAIDFLKFKYSFLDHVRNELDIEEAPKDGVYIYGLFLEAAKWNL
jgi:dynein heavy chain